MDVDALIDQMLAASTPAQIAAASEAADEYLASAALDDPDTERVLDAGEQLEMRRLALESLPPGRRLPTDPAGWQRAKDRARASRQGGPPGEWSQRKSIIAQALYAGEGGAFISASSVS